jgi:hypothetical protein
VKNSFTKKKGDNIFLDFTLKLDATMLVKKKERWLGYNSKAKITLQL